jgi:DNA-binding Lrp family transcriptional regulator
MVAAYVLIQTQVGKLGDVAREATRIPGVLSADGVTGPYDVVVRAEAGTLDELVQLIVQRIQEIEGVTRTLTCPVIHL